RSLLQYGAETISPTSIIFKSDNAPAIPTPRADSFRKHAPKRSHLDAFKNSAGRVRVAGSEGPCLRLALHVDDDQAAGSVGEGSRNRDFALFRERSQIVEVGGPEFRPEFRAPGPVVPDYYKEHRSPSRRNGGPILIK